MSVNDFTTGNILFWSILDIILGKYDLIALHAVFSITLSIPSFTPSTCWLRIPTTVQRTVQYSTPDICSMQYKLEMRHLGLCRILNISFLPSGKKFARRMTSLYLLENTFTSRRQTCFAFFIAKPGRHIPSDLFSQFVWKATYCKLRFLLWTEKENRGLIRIWQCWWQYYLVWIKLINMTFTMGFLFLNPSFCGGSFLCEMTPISYLLYLKSLPNLFWKTQWVPYSECNSNSQFNSISDKNCARGEGTFLY